MYKEIESVEKEIKNTIEALEKDYGMPYEDMYNCYNKNNYAIDYHIGVSFVEGMERSLRIIRNRLKESR